MIGELRAILGMGVLLRCMGLVFRENDASRHLFLS